MLFFPDQAPFTEKTLYESLGYSNIKEKEPYLRAAYEGKIGRTRHQSSSPPTD